jgi:hypothetical protein
LEIWIAFYHEEGMKLYNTLIIHIQILGNVQSNAEGINHYRMALKGDLSKDSMFTSPCA